ncbi:RNA polymerase-associated protein RapA [bacterium HR25]|nr:RNA polymerase-associated protein RapA [bacterium HR25]
MSLRECDWRSAYGPADRPLESFYIAALSRAVRYDRIAGFFSSYALAVAAQGVAKLVARGGQMRLLVGAHLSAEDVEAVLRGLSLEERLAQSFLPLLTDPQALADALVRERLKVLAWLVAQGRLEVRVVVEADPYTRQPVASGGYFHAKGGILWDEAGDGIAFSGSINETATAWRYNYESFHVFCSWREPEHFRHEAETFRRLWEGAEEGWLTLPLPEAVQRELVRMAPAEPPLEEPALLPLTEEEGKLRWAAQFIRDAPFLVHKGWRVGVETAPIRPFPHQRAVAYDVLDRFPCRRLLADEVGLGKTIEAGFILRSLLLSGWVRRCLVLVPRSLARQWQEELWERFQVEAPFYDGSRFVWFSHPANRYQEIPEGESPWEMHPVVIASAQMAKRQQRAKGLLEAPPWDLVIVDEAHHARRRDFLDLDRYRPNRLLWLLEQVKQRTRGLLLLTATPMQVHPVELWDLLRLLGMPGRWQDDQGAFLAFFGELSKPLGQVNWEAVLPLVREAIDSWGWDERWEGEARGALGSVGLQRIKGVLDGGGRKVNLVLTEQEQEWLLKAVRQHSPVGRLLYRHTRSLLRHYHERGWMRERVPERRPEPVWLELSDEEEALYGQVERYISTYYKRYEELRRGLGFVMTVYRRRLTSSLFALKRSLERRRQFLLGQWRDDERPAGLEDEDMEEAELDEDAFEELERPAFWDEEVGEVDRLLASLESLPRETKLAALLDHLERLLRQYDQVLVFTQYTDTLDFLRGELVHSFGSRLGCYSGRGGEVWDDRQGRWAGVSKAEVQRRFEDGGLKVLVCTEAAGEGLNLQSCGVVINYDMPWNPMKVEQRIGRIDRLGQRRQQVHVLHFFYRDTVEAKVYEALSQRIGWFENVVGELQPILQRAHAAIQRAAMLAPEERGPVLREELEELARVESLPAVEGWKPYGEGLLPEAPLTSEDLDLPILAKRGSGLAVGQAESGSLGIAILEGMLELPPPPARPDLVRLERLNGVRRVGYYRFWKGSWRPVSTLRQLLDALEAPAGGQPSSIAEARRRFEEECITL